MAAFMQSELKRRGQGDDAGAEGGHAHIDLQQDRHEIADRAADDAEQRADSDAGTEARDPQERQIERRAGAAQHVPRGKAARGETQAEEAQRQRGAAVRLNRYVAIRARAP